MSPNQRLGGIFPDRPLPEVCVWEITRQCNIHCLHCGSSAGRPRDAELTQEESLRVIRDLAALGCACVTFSGGEPLLRAGWAELASAVREQGMQVELISNGLLVEEQAEAIVRAGFVSVSLSIDGPQAVHDHLRGLPGSLDRVLAGARALSARGVLVGAVTQVNQMNLPHLRTTHDLLREHGITGWQIQLTVPYGRAALEPGLCLCPEALPALEAVIVRIVQETPMFVQAADTIGYMSRCEPLLRTGSRRGNRIWGGCQAGLRTVGLTSDGTVRGCLSMPAEMDEGNIRERPLAEIWRDPERFTYRRRFDPERLAGACADCAYRRWCGGGCAALAFATTGGTAENPYCLHRLARGMGSRGAALLGGNCAGSSSNTSAELVTGSRGGRETRRVGWRLRNHFSA